MVTATSSASAILNAIDPFDHDEIRLALASKRPTRVILGLEAVIKSIEAQSFEDQVYLLACSTMRRETYQKAASVLWKINPSKYVALLRQHAFGSLNPKNV